MLSSWCNYVNRSVSRRLAFCIISIGLFVAVIALVVRLVFTFQQNYLLLKNRIAQTVEVLLPPIQNALDQHDSELLAAQLSRLTSSSDIDSVRLSWRNELGEVRSRVYPKTASMFRNPWLITPDLAVDGISKKPKIISFEVDISFAAIFSEIKKEAIKNSIIILLEAFIIASILIRFMTVMITRHLRDMSYYASRLGIDKLHETFKLNRMEKAGTFDELDELALALNNMRKKLHDDVKERQIMELSLSAAKEEESRARRQHLASEASNKAKSQFIATVSHEIRTPMNGIVGMIDLLGATPLDESQKQYIEIIKSSGASLIRVINDILDYSKIEADKLQLDHIDFNLEDLIDECVQLFSATSIQNHVELLSTVSSTTPRFLRGDPTRLRQIILNLLGNAFKFTQNGYVCLNVSLALGGGRNEPLLHFSVTDTGIGIARQLQGDLFKPFSQADSTITRKFGGTGLGLAIAQNLTRLMGGEIGVESEEGKGAAFWFTAKLELATAPVDDHEFEGKHILLVNQDRLFNASIIQYCQAWGIACRVVDSGEDALLELNQAVNALRYDAVLVNYDLPDQSGESLIAKLHNQSSRLKAILICSHLLLGDSKPTPTKLFLPRPVTGIRLKQVLHRALVASSELLERSQPKALTQFPNLKVLVAEDNPVNCLVIEGILKRLGITPLIASNGELAYELFIRNPEFDLILMDCEMPVLDGFAATQKIRQWELQNHRTETHIVALTAHVESEHKKRVFSSGMDYYLSKPVTFKDISDTIEELGLG